MKECEGDNCYWKIRAKLLGDAVRDAFAFWFGADKLYEDAGQRFWDSIKDDKETKPLKAVVKEVLKEEDDEKDNI